MVHGQCRTNCTCVTFKEYYFSQQGVDVYCFYIDQSLAFTSEQEREATLLGIAIFLVLVSLVKVHTVKLKSQPEQHGKSEMI